MVDMSGPEDQARIWVDRLEIFIADGVDERDAVAFGAEQVRTCPPAQAGIRYLPLSAAEWADWTLLADAASYMRQYFGLPVARLSADRLHIVSVTDMRTWFGRSDAYVKGGHAYVAEHVRYSPAQWVIHLSHELAHLTSFLSARVEIRPTEGGRLVADLRYEKHGLKRVSKSDSLTFTGLNEAVTELAALQIRYVAGLMSPPFRERYLDGGDRITGYGGQVMLLEGLCRQMVGSGVFPWEDDASIKEAILFDYLSGTNQFLDALADSAPQTWGWLSLMGDDPLTDDAVKEILDTCLV